MYLDCQIKEIFVCISQRLLVMYMALYMYKIENDFHLNKKNHCIGMYVIDF